MDERFTYSLKVVCDVTSTLVVLGIQMIQILQTFGAMFNVLVNSSNAISYIIHSGRKHLQPTL